MSGALNILVIVAALAFVLTRLVRPQRVDPGGQGRRWWLVPAVLVFVAVRQPGLLDHAHRGTSAALLVVGVVVGLLTGAAWAWTTRLSTDASGARWSTPRPATYGVWVLGIALRVGVHFAGSAMGIHQSSHALMLSVAATLLARTGVLLWRAGAHSPAYRVPAGA